MSQSGIYFIHLINFSDEKKLLFPKYRTRFILCGVRIFEYERWGLERNLSRVLTTRSMTWCQSQKNMLCRPYFIKLTTKCWTLLSLFFSFLFFSMRRFHWNRFVLKKARIHGEHSGAVSPNFLCPQNFVVTRMICFKHLIRQKSCPAKMHFASPEPLNLDTWPGSKPSLNQFSAITCSQVTEHYRNAKIIGVSSLVNRSNLDYYAVGRTTVHLFTKTNSKWNVPQLTWW